MHHACPTATQLFDDCDRFSDLAAGIQAKFACKEQAVILSSHQLGHLVLIGNLVAHQPPADDSTSAPVSLDKLLLAASQLNDAAEAAYNEAVIQWEQVQLAGLSGTRDIAD